MDMLKLAWSRVFMNRSDALMGIASHLASLYLKPSGLHSKMLSPVVIIVNRPMGIHSVA